MTARVAATVGNGRVLARIGRDGSLISLCSPHLDDELIDTHMYAVVKRPQGVRRVGGAGWKHHLEYVRGTNVLRVLSNHSTRIKVERRIAAIGESLQTSFRAEAGDEVGWEQGLGEVLPQAGTRVDEAWPDAFDPPPLAGATRAAVVARVPDLADRGVVTDLY